MIGRALFVVMLLVYSSGAWGQPAVVFFYYAEGTPLGAPCENGAPYPDGTPITVVQDRDRDGVDGGDLWLATLPFNGELLLGQAGYFWAESGFTLAVPGDLLLPYGLQINAGASCWRSDTIRLFHGYQEVNLSLLDWSCADALCLPHPPAVQFCSELSLPRRELCGDGDPLAIGTPVRVRCDANASGPDSADPVIAAFHFTSPGHFQSAWLDVAGPAGEHQTYLQIQGTSCCWQTRLFTPDSLPVHHDLLDQDWECYSGVCFDSAVNAAPPAPLPLRSDVITVYPNPFNATTRISFSVVRAGEVTLRVYSLDGRLVKELLNGLYAPGAHTVTWDAAGLASGIYLCRFEGGADRETRRLLLLR